MSSVPDSGWRTRGVLVAVLVGALVHPSPATAAEQPPETPTSLGEALLYHLQFATNIDPTGLAVDEGDVFAVGAPRVLTLVGWDYAPSGTELRLRLFEGERLVYEDARSVRTQGRSGYIFNYEPPGGLVEGTYTAELQYNGVLDEVAAFQVTPDGGAGSPAPPANTDGLSGAVAYADPADVLVVTRASVLRGHMGPAADEVLDAAADVGELVDLDTLGVDASIDASVAAVRDLLRRGGQRYLLIVGNDDAVPYARLENPVASGESSSLDGWELPAEWVPSDDTYGDLDGDRWGVPEIGVARIPSSEDAELLLTQLGEIVPPDGGAFVLLNQKRRGQGEAVTETIDDVVPVETHYTPPTAASRIPDTGATNARFTYVLLHGIGVTTDTWSADVVAWRPRTADLNGEFEVGGGGQLPGMTVAVADTTGGIVDIGNCYGGWTLDTIQQPAHKTAENALALDYLRSGTRAYIAHTHISYSYLIDLDGPYLGGTGFEVLLWRTMLEGATPIDAYLNAKQRLAQQIDESLALDDVDSAAVTLKTLRNMVYFGRP